MDKKKALSRKDIEDKMSDLPLERIYKFICNTTAITSDSNEYYSEVVSEYVLMNAEELQGIQQRGAWMIEPSEGLDYFSDYRANITQAQKQDDGKPHLKIDDEKILCREMYIRCKNGMCYEGIGKIIDFETPLAHLREVDKEQYRSRKVGNVDMISCSFEDEPTIWLLEVKREKSDESMYRCIMEGFTYLQTIDKERFIRDLKKHDSQFETIQTPIRFRTAPLIAYEGKQHQEMKEAGEKPNLHKKLLELMHFLDITVYFSYKIELDKIVIRKHFI